MAKMYFDKTVQYNGVKFAPRATFEVLDSDVEELQRAGGWLAEEPKVLVAEEEEEKPKAKKKK